MPKGSIGCERLRSPRLDQLTKLADEASEEELLVMRNYCAHRLAARTGFPDEPGRRAAQRRNRCIVALSDADLRKRQQTGDRLCTTSDYQQFKAPGDPSLSTIYREFHSFERALSEAGVALTAQAEGTLLSRVGRPHGGGRSWTLDERVSALALAIEDAFGFQVTKLAYEDFRERWDADLPSYNQIIGAQQRGAATEGLPHMHQLAYRLIAEHPAEFPNSHARVVSKLERKEHT